MRPRTSDKYKHISNSLTHGKVRDGDVDNDGNEPENPAEQSDEDKTGGSVTYREESEYEV